MRISPRHLIAKEGDMKLGLHLPIAGHDTSPEAIARTAEEAERIGLDSVWAWERLLRPTVPIAMGGPGGPVMDPPEAFGSVYDPLDTLAYVAARTTRVTLGTSVLVSLFQNPIILARRIATIDRLSGGRLVAGIGQGWMEQEFTAAGVPMSRRGAGFEEHIMAMRAVWGPDPVRFDGRHYQIPESEIGPKPVRPGGPTLLIGAAVPAAVERAARLGAGLTLVIFDFDAIRETVATFRRAAEAAGHDPASLPIALQVNGSVTAKPLDERAPLTGSPEQVATDLEALDADHVFWNDPMTPTDEQLHNLAQLVAK
ncbi:TIGR03619 family F420-dependent LLM class oxidoreductase [Actinomadura rudentiformis]|uniref:TIGR03619 family F420-dependent LLM class oxidoreductase n=1 Tax=Actinomadura rudentiformis TaxID=359158 RepID=A0A6H9Z3M8_9ACTN|nr:TIGR03619 family F420-dependent LLM class oxidoreductase [Actinomadura rudentiformis]KAB2349421.1 TIGR03619 family F420-dependent LLM class oxidoreductase [Actinomadura rudentiformis]